MKARLIGGFVCVAVLTAGGSWAEDNLEAVGSAALAAVTTAVAVAAVEYEATDSPFIHPEVSADVRDKLLSASKLALDSVKEENQCGELFASLGADGQEMLNKTLYFRARALNRKDGVCRRAAIYTTIGGKSTFVCPEFSSLSDERAAMFLIHEALHHAGLTEKPLDRRGMTSLQINSMVAKKCRF